MKFKLQECEKLNLSPILFAVTENSALVISKIKEVESKTQLWQAGEM